MTAAMSTRLVLLFFMIVAVVIAWPLLLNMDSLIIDTHDGLLITWIMNWNIHSFTTGIGGLINLYSANIFYPYQNTLAYSDLHLPLSLLALPWVIVTGQPLVAYNTSLFLGFVLTGWSLFILLRLLTGKNKLSILLSALFTFSTLHLNYSAHPQLFNFWPIILATLFLFQKRFRLFILFFLVSALTTALYFYFLLVLVTIYLWSFPTSRKQVLISTLLAVIITTPFLFPYNLVSRQFDYVRPMTDAIHFSLQFPDLLNISQASRLSTFIPPTSAGTPAYFGAVFSLLLLFTIYQLIKKRVFLGEAKQRFFKFSIVLALVSFVMALGPALHIFPDTVRVGPLAALPLPYAFFYYTVPGFAGLRTPSRWILLTAFALVLVLGILSRSKLSWRWVMLLISLVIVEINFPFSYHRVPKVEEFPPEQLWLRDNFLGAPIIQFPIYNWDNKEFGQETLREYYSTIHWHRMFNGYSGFSPPEWERRVKWLQKSFPSKDSLSYLRSLKIELILAPREWRGELFSYDELRLVKGFERTDVFELL